jgi:heme exporter protein C
MRWEHGLLALGFLLLTIGHGMGLFVAPEEAMMGEAGRILYAHVPTAWVALVTLTFSFFAAIGSLWTGSYKWDAAVEATAETGVVLTALLLFQGSMWAKPTWGVFWDWDPRLTTSAILLVLFVAVLVVRKVVTEPERRLTVTAIAAIIAYVDVPVVYFGVKWWRSLHQIQSSPETVASTMVTPLRIAAFAMLFISIAVCVMRWRTLYGALKVEATAPDLPELPVELALRESEA